jgi:uncharacterized BrkB/YihY/UPF0761 family membrane protein
MPPTKEEPRFFKDFVTQSRKLTPLFRYLVLQTETHAFCLGLACAALIGFYPFCFLLLALMRYSFQWSHGESVVIAALHEYFPAAQDYFVRNLKLSVVTFGSKLQVVSILWILLGAAGIFIPLESGLNRLWKVDTDRPYWKNQLIGFSLTMACGLLAIAFVAVTTFVQEATHLVLLLDYLASKSSVFATIENFLDVMVLKLIGTCFLSLAILLFYKFLPNRHIELRQVLSAAILAGILAEVVKDLCKDVLFPFMDIDETQGPFFVSVSFVLMAYFETFVVLGCAFLAVQEQTFKWSSFFRRRINDRSSDLPFPKM